MLHQLKPARALAKVAAAMFKDIWDHRAAQAGALAKSVGDQISDTEKKINDLIELVVNASHPRVVAAYEKKIESLEMKKLTLAEKQRNVGQPVYPFSQMFELSMKFLANPCILWDSGRLELQRIVLKLVFSEELSYCKKSGFRTPKTTLPFKVLGDFDSRKCEMVPPERLELPTL
ncbi:MAG: hypothetical protein HLUCCO18_17430 [Rhodobacteraceae bacterium HLUCCO18]|nr:MAG: hypothetical protein HLUCCO18_17430 [Rhodobacteraceae bacterium HLUCCO18]